jgi:hypothetical protein
VSTKPKLKPFEDIVAAWRRGFHSALAADRDREEAIDWVVDDSCDRVRSRVKELIRRRARETYIGPGVVTAVVVEWERIPCTIHGVQVKGPIMLPLVKAYYAVEERVYRAYFSGWDMKPLIREEPFTTTQRVVLTAAGGLASGLLGAAGALLGAEIGGTWGLVAAAVVAAIGAAAGYVASRAALRPVRRETGGPASWVTSIDEAIEEAVGKARGRF